MIEATYPASPGFKERDSTSQEAAESVTSRAKILRKRVFDRIKSSPCSADQCAYEMNESVLSVRPRFSELRADGLIEPTGRCAFNSSGKRAKVWKAVERRVQTELSI